MNIIIGLLDWRRAYLVPRWKDRPTFPKSRVARHRPGEINGRDVEPSSSRSGGSTSANVN
jgi:hypothetical protein